MVLEWNRELTVHIRRCYESEGYIFPGPKGITLSLEELWTLCAVLPAGDGEDKGDEESDGRKNGG